MSLIQDALYPYQHEDVEWLKEHPRAINGNAMGLGKTVEALALCDSLGLGHVLIVCKKTLIGEWFYQIDRWLDGDCLTPHDNSQYDHRLAGLNLNDPRFVCVNYEMLSMPRYFDILNAVPWSSIVYDEAHHLKNHKSKRTKSSWTCGS